MMLYRDCAAFFEALPEQAPLAGIDPGSKRVGLAVGHLHLRIALPLTVVPRTAFAKDMPEVRRLLHERSAAGLVVGLPLNMDGSSGSSAQSAGDFAARLCKVLQLPVLLLDERLTTASAERRLLSLDVSRAKRSATVDAHAAALILEAFFDRLRFI